MKLLVILCGNEFQIKHLDCIQTLDKYLILSGMDVEYCGISNQDDFYVFESIISFKYKIINKKKQLSKICDFITDYKSELNYDWFIKIRPDIKLLDHISFDKLSEDEINARARVYNGPKIIPYGLSVYGEGPWKYLLDYKYDTIEHDIIMDDHMYIFHKKLVLKNAFDKIVHSVDLVNNDWNTKEHEWMHTRIFNERKIKINVIGIQLNLTKYNAFSGNINMDMFNESVA